MALASMCLINELTKFMFAATICLIDFNFTKNASEHNLQLQDTQ